jgi:hypothetical protein
MSLERANEMVKFLKNLNEERTDAGEATGFKAREMYDFGMTYGVTNMEMLQTFLGKERAISRGRYLPTELSEERIQSATKPKASKGPRKRKVVNLGSVSMDDVVAAAQASKTSTPSVNKADRLAMIREIAQRKEAEEMAEKGASELCDEEEKSFDNGDSPEETCFEFEPIEYTQDDVEEELALMDTYI